MEFVELYMTVELTFASISLEVRRQDAHPIMKCENVLVDHFFLNLQPRRTIMDIATIVSTHNSLSLSLP